ncbi:MAG: hypothetical protein Q4G26_12220 [Paracoccus sp. (in: a-proteobacteria)]|nr:hypothetical protein [Paracoccus sp. (in: a-proteobacteria)]
MIAIRQYQATTFPALAGRSLAPPALIAAALLALTACAGGPRNTDEILRGGVPASTNLPRATTIPPETVRTVTRRDYGWRLIYHAASAPADAEARAARALCRLERRGVAQVIPVAMAEPRDDPGARMIEIHCA